MTDAEHQTAYRHIARELPFLLPLVEATGRRRLPAPTGKSVASSLVEIVAGQMLSRTAAQTILKRLTLAAEQNGFDQLYDLPKEILRSCGLSGRKARTVSAISELAHGEPARLEGWRALDWHNLRREVSSIWGLSDWSAGVLAIFEFGLPDVFPLGDGSLVRAMRLIEHHHMGEGEPFPHERGTPYGSYLAITLWAALDDGLLPLIKK